MAKTLRIYDNNTDYSGYMIPGDVAKIINPTHYQGSVYVSGYSKADAVESLNSVTPSFHAKPNHLRIGMGNTLDALRSAGLFNETGVVLATPMTAYGVVLRVDKAGIHYIGDLVSTEQRSTPRFVALPNTYL